MEWTRFISPEELEDQVLLFMFLFVSIASEKDANHFSSKYP